MEYHLERTIDVLTKVAEALEKGAEVETLYYTSHIFSQQLNWFL